MIRLPKSLRRSLAAASLALAASLPAHAAFVYTLDVAPNRLDGFGDFTLTVANLITSDTTLDLSAFDAIQAPPGATAVSFTFGPVGSNSADIFFPGSTVGGVFFNYPDALMSPGTYCSGFSNPVGCGGRAATMTITETTGSVPEPGSLALLGAAAAAAALARRRAAC